MTTNSLFSLCQQHKDAWLSNGTHAVHYRLPYVNAKYTVKKDGKMLCSACNDSDLKEQAEQHAIDLLKGWFLVAHS